MVHSNGESVGPPRVACAGVCGGRDMRQSGATLSSKLCLQNEKSPKVARLSTRTLTQF